jgi:AbrB family looped-hinge helix DNA binding protein
MNITKLSTKGQIVIPEEIRRDIETGTAFIVSRQNDLIVLKPVDGLTKQEIQEMKELDNIWKDIDSGECESYTVREFFDKLTEWQK